MSFATVQPIVAKKVADTAKKELYGLRKFTEVDWGALVLKTAALYAIELNDTVGELSTTEVATMLSRISNPNLNI